MRKLIYILLFFTLRASAQQTGLTPGSTPGTGQFQPKVLGTGATARMFTSFGGNTYFELPTVKALLDSIAAVRATGSANAVLRAGNSTTGSAPYFGNQLPSYYLNYTNLTNKPTIYAFTGASSQLTNGDGTYRTLSNSDVTTALGFTPYNNTNPNNYISRTGLSASGSLSYNNATGVFSYTQPTNVSIFTNDAAYLTNTTGDSRYGQLGANNTWAVGNNFQGTTNVPNISALANDSRAANTAYVDGAITALKAANNTWTGVNNFTNASFKASGLTYIGGSANFNLDPAATPAIPTASSPISGVFIGANRSAAQGEIDFINIIGTSGSAIGGWSFRQRTTGGTETELFKSNGTTGDFSTFGRLAPGQIDHLGSTPYRWAAFDNSTNSIVYRTGAELLADIGSSVTTGTQKLATFYTTVNSTTAAADVYSYTLLANTFSSDGQFIDGKIDGSGTGSGTYTIQLSFGGNNFANYTISNSGSTNMQFELYRTSSSTMRCIVHGNYPTGYQYGSIDFTGISYTGTNIIKANIVHTGTLQLSLTDAFYRLNP